MCNYILNPNEENDSKVNYQIIIARIKLKTKFNTIKQQRITKYKIKDILYDSFCNKKNKQTQCTT